MADYDETSAFSSPLGRRVGYGTTASTSLRLAAPAPQQTTPSSNRVVHRVQPNDTIQGIALKYNVTVEELRRLNKLWTNDSVWLRSVLLIPSSSSTDDEVVSISTDSSLDGSVSAAVEDDAGSTSSAAAAAPSADGLGGRGSADFLSRMDSSLLAAISNLKTIAAAADSSGAITLPSSRAVQMQQPTAAALSTGDFPGAVERHRGGHGVLQSRGNIWPDLRETPEAVVRSTSSAQDRMERLQDELFQL